jgi:hypothetical protein
MLQSVAVVPSLRKPWRDRWPDVTDRRLLVHAMEDAGVPREDVLTWMSAPFSGYRAEDVLEVALHWQASVLPLATTIAWAQTGVFEPKDALRWHLKGFDADQAAFINSLLGLGRERLDFDECQAREVDWLSCGLPPRWVCLFVALDVSIPEAHILYARAKREHDLEGLLALYAYLRGADPCTLRIDMPRLLGLADGEE